MKTTFMQIILGAGIILGFLFSGCDSSNGVFSRDEVVFDSITEKIYTMRKSPITGVIVEEYVDKESGESIQRQIKINKGVITDVIDLKVNGQIFKNYKHRMKQVQKYSKLLSLAFLTEDRKDSVLFYEASSIKDAVKSSVVYVSLNGVFINEITYNDQGKMLRSKDLETNCETFYDESGQVAKIIKYSTDADTITVQGKIAEIYDRVKHTESFYENGKLAKVYHLNKDNIRAKEVIYSNGKAVKTNILIKEPTVFNNYGIELVTYKTGFYKKVTSTGVAWVPMIILKLKNISGRTLTNKDQVKILSTFLDGDEEWGSDYEYVPSFSSGPWTDGITKQIDISGSMGYVYIQGIVKANIKCQLYVNDELYKTIKIQNKGLISNRIN